MPRREIDVTRTNFVIPEPLLQKLAVLKETFGAVTRSETIRCLIYQKFQELKAEGKIHCGCGRSATKLVAETRDIPGWEKVDFSVEDLVNCQVVDGQWYRPKCAESLQIVLDASERLLKSAKKEAAEGDRKCTR